LKFSRERTKQQVAHLEDLVRTLQAANERPEQLSELLFQVDKGREEIRRLKETLSRIHHLAVPENAQPHTEQAKNDDRDRDPSPSPVGVFNPSTNQPDDSFVENLAGHKVSNGHSLLDPQMFGCPSIFPTLDSTSVPGSGDYHFPTEGNNPLLQGFEPPRTLSKPSNTNIESENDPVVAIASKILTTPRLEGRWLVLAGSVLNHCLTTNNELFTPRILDDDIAIRACVEGWEIVSQLYWLDAGWRWLRQVSQSRYEYSLQSLTSLDNLMRICTLICRGRKGWRL
jgi:hypothetical protein